MLHTSYLNCFQIIKKLKNMIDAKYIKTCNAIPEWHGMALYIYSRHTTWTIAILYPALKLKIRTYWCNTRRASRGGGGMCKNISTWTAGSHSKQHRKYIVNVRQPFWNGNVTTLSTLQNGLKLLSKVSCTEQKKKKKKTVDHSAMQKLSNHRVHNSPILVVCENRQDALPPLIQADIQDL